MTLQQSNVHTKLTKKRPRSEDMAVEHAPQPCADNDRDVLTDPLCQTRVPTFPLPDWLDSVEDRPLVDIGAFAADTHDVERFAAPASVPYAQPRALHVVDEEDAVKGLSDTALLSSSVIAALQTQASNCKPPQWTPCLPTFAQLCPASTSASTSAPTSGSGSGSAFASTRGSPAAATVASAAAYVPEVRCCGTSFVEVVTYDSETPTKSAVLRLPTDARLAALIDLIPCSARATSPSAQCRARSRRMLCIESVLYADDRLSDVDVVTHVQEHLEPHVSLPIVRLSDAPLRLMDLSVRLGEPYAFLHYGDCEHVIVFTDVFRTLQPSCSDSRSTSASQSFSSVSPSVSPGESPSPFSVAAPAQTEANEASVATITWRRAPRVLACNVCQVRMAVKFTIVDYLADAIPFNYCHLCFGNAHFSGDGLPLDRSMSVIAFDYMPLVLEEQTAPF